MAGTAAAAAVVQVDGRWRGPVAAETMQARQGNAELQPPRLGSEKESLGGAVDARYFLAPDRAKRRLEHRAKCTRLSGTDASC